LYSFGKNCSNLGGEIKKIIKIKIKIKIKNKIKIFENYKNNKEFF
jgi:hypothetical protein